MTKKEKYFHIACDLVRDAYQNGRLDVVCRTNTKWEGSYSKEQLDRLIKLFNISETEDDNESQSSET